MTTVLDRMTDRYSGLFWKRNFALLERWWEPTWDILGTTATILPLLGLGDDGLPNAASFTTRRGNASGLEAVFTWQATDGGPSNWTNGNDFTSPDRWQGIVPVVDFDGTNDEGDTPSAAFWDGGDNTNDNTLSYGVWVNLDATATEDLLVRDDSGGTGSWRLGTRRLFMRDQSETTQCRRDRDSNPSLGVWHHLVVTYSGVGGGSAANGITMYEDGVVAASTATNGAGYVAMEADGQRVTLANSPPSSQFFNGRMAGGPLGLFLTKTELTAAQIKRLYHLGRAALGL